MYAVNVHILISCLFCLCISKGLLPNSLVEKCPVSSKLMSSDCFFFVNCSLCWSDRWLTDYSPKPFYLITIGILTPRWKRGFKCAVKPRLTHYIVWNACAKSGPLRYQLLWWCNIYFGLDFDYESDHCPVILLFTLIFRIYVLCLLRHACWQSTNQANCLLGNCIQ